MSADERAARIAAWAQRLAEQAPPATPEQIDRVRVLLAQREGGPPARVA